MALTEEQERQWIAELERMGPTQVRSLLDQDKITPALVFLSSHWLSEKDREGERREAASQSEQIALMRRAASAAELQADEARRANTKATIALIIAIASPIVTAIIAAIGIWLPYWSTHK